MSVSVAHRSYFKCSVVTASWCSTGVALMGSPSVVTGPCRKALLSFANEKKL